MRPKNLSRYLDELSRTKAERRKIDEKVYGKETTVSHNSPSLLSVDRNPFRMGLLLCIFRFIQIGGTIVVTRFRVKPLFLIYPLVPHRLVYRQSRSSPFCPTMRIVLALLSRGSSYRGFTIVVSECWLYSYFGN